MLGDIAPFRIAGNLYFVGTHAKSCHVLATSRGLIMIDSGGIDTVDAILESLDTLGFSPQDLKIVLLTHGHPDHAGGAKRLREISGAEVFLAEEDLKYVGEGPSGFVPDRFLQDGDEVALGDTVVTCLFTPGHTEGSFSFFFDLVENGMTYRAGMFGGSGVNQLKKSYMNRPDRRVSYLMRGAFFKTLDRLEEEHVDVTLGNHTWQNNQDEKMKKLFVSPENPFIDPTEWRKYLAREREALWKIIREETKSAFVNYAHRGASETRPENTMTAFYEGVALGANGIETDVQMTRDGVPVLFHDDALLRVTGEPGSIGDYTLAELRKFTVKKDGMTDRIPTLEELLAALSWRDLTFAIELKGEGAEEAVADLVYRYGVDCKCVVTSFVLDRLRRVRAIAPDLRTGWLKKDFTDEDIEAMQAAGVDELCPRAENVTPERVEEWHALGFNVRPWAVTDDALMRAAVDAGVDGMTVNFPDRLAAYLGER
ncbi:MAG: MBL fold metallo-hydrolase [Clostridia bacterium]|nr:MBL fold metallo-hydrolase [Clostridia bacterium]